MRYAFLNNFSQILAADLAAGATTLTLDGGGSLLSNASADLVYTLTLVEKNGDGKEVGWEIVHVTGASGNDLTIERGKEGTTDAAWPTGTQVGMRVTAGVMDSLMWTLLVKGVATGSGIAIGGEDAADLVAAAGAYADRSMALMPGSEATETDAFAAGNGSGAYGVRAFALAAGSAYGDDATAVGVGSESYGNRSCALAGGYAYADDSFAAGLNARATGLQSAALFGGQATGDESFAWGDGAIASGFGAIALCSAADAYGDRAVSIGFSATAGEDSIAIGSGASATQGAGTGTGMALGKNASAAPGTCAWGEDAQAQAPAGMAAGKGASSMAPENVAWGVGAAVMTPYSVALGAYARNANVPGGFQLNAISYLPATPDDTGTYAGPPPSATRRASQQVVIATDALDLTDDTDAVTLALPPNTMLFIDAIDVIITGSDTPGGSPEITVGPDAGSPAAYLAATPVGKTAVGERETYSPPVTDGVTSLRVATTTAGTGTTYQAKIVFRGYVMEL